MRAKEPFHGIILVGGHVVFHVALLIGSVFVIRFPEITETNRDLMQLVDWFRAAHLLNVVYYLVDYCLSAPERFHKFMFTQKLFETISMFTYFVVAMYALWSISKIISDEMPDDKLLQKARVWLFIEIAGFHLQIFAAAFLLFYVQCKGMFGKTLQPTSKRHKSDALGYYMEDISWFNLIFVTLFVHALSFQSNTAEGNKTSEPIKLAYSCLMFASRLLQLYFFMPLRYVDLTYHVISQKVWIFFAVIELIGLGMTFGFSSYRGITTATSFVELAVFAGQAAWYYRRTHTAAAAENDAAQADPDAERKKEEAARNGAAQYVAKPKRTYGVEDSIYNFAIYAMIHPDVIKAWPDNG